MNLLIKIAQRCNRTRNENKIGNAGVIARVITCLFPNMACCIAPGSQVIPFCSNGLHLGIWISIVIQVFVSILSSFFMSVFATDVGMFCMSPVFAISSARSFRSFRALICRWYFPFHEGGIQIGYALTPPSRTGYRNYRRLFLRFFLS